ncbi:DNA polymerase I [Salinibacterium sp. SYSU T00001]|uniref:DNA polymerase I n=1 Tax=Homoserinimonas sedimenticola TaxID=2986805 RepID=UPI002235F907|nr:DNA polymerase I [Salinibacterium sedimenticola]MCW4384379.1 DNA polymerase I [Salinibacterium sedimenticola]
MSDTAKPTLLVVDGHSLAFRAFYALPVDSFVNREGQHTNAIHGFLSMLLSLLAQEKPTHLAVAFDISRYSFRTREYAEYKGTRGETPPEFIGQVPLLEEALSAMNIVTISKEDYEADDILATLATRGAAEGYRVLVVSGDRDTIQLVNDDVTLLYPNARGVSELKRYDRDAVMERYGIEPEQYPDVAALVGETSDNLIGIDKVGEKTAVKWINQYGSLDEILAHADEIKGVVGQNLRDQKENAIRNRRLNRLVTDVELPVGPADLERRQINVAAVREVFDRLQFRTLLERVLKIAAAEGSTEALTSAAAVDDSGAAQLAPVVRTLVDEELAQWLAKRTGPDASPLGLRVEIGAEGITGFGIATLDDSVYVPWAEGRPDYAALESWLASDAPKVLLDAKRQYKALATAGLDLAGIAFDTSLASWLLRPSGKSEDLASQVYAVLGETVTVSDPNQLLPEVESLSAATEAWYVLRIADALRERLDEGTARVLADIELPLVPVLARMELTGIQVVPTVLADLRSRLAASAAGFAAEAYREIGREVNLGSPKQLQQVLFEELGMPKTRANKTGYSTDAASLADLQEKSPHPFLGLLLQHRDVTKLGQIVDTLEKSVRPDGRIHTTYEQTGTSTGRISSNDPNLQNIPIKTEVGREIRSSFTHGSEFSTLLTADYSQIEMRIMAHLSGDPGLIEAFNAGEDLHRFVGARIFHVEPSDVTPLMRTKVKAMSYGLAYGLSAFGLSKQLRIDTAEAKQLMTDYFARFGAVRDYLRSVVEKAREDGYTETIFGRRRPFGDLRSNNRVLRENAERAALNAPIQGTAADIMKIAMVDVARDIREKGLRSRMLLQVHDELVFEVADGEVEPLTEIVRTRMGGAAELAVPLEVQVGIGANWDAAAH